MPNVRGGFRSDHTGKVFGRLTVLGDSGNRDKYDRRLWLLQCSCPEKTIIEKPSCYFVTGSTASCGCLKRDLIKERLTTHGESKKAGKYEQAPASSEYVTWCAIWNRCTKDGANSKYYKDKGIRVCDRWAVYENFLEDMGRKPHPYFSIHRKDSSKGYCKENCEWADDLTQGREKSGVHWVEIDGKKLTLTQWSEETGIKYRTLVARWAKGDTGKHLIRPVKIKKGESDG